MSPGGECTSRRECDVSRRVDYTDGPTASHEFNHSTLDKSSLEVAPTTLQPVLLTGNTYSSEGSIDKQNKLIFE